MNNVAIYAFLKMCKSKENSVVTPTGHVRWFEKTKNAESFFHSHS